jgi:hypothetical protein
VPAFGKRDAEGREDVQRLGGGDVDGCIGRRTRPRRPRRASRRTGARWRAGISPPSRSWLRMAFDRRPPACSRSTFPAPGFLDGVAFLRTRPPQLERRGDVTAPWCQHTNLRRDAATRRRPLRSRPYMAGAAA